MKVQKLIFFTIFCCLGMQTAVFSQRLIKSYQDYIEQNNKLAVKQMEKHQIPASITLAQALLESGAGMSELSTKGNNHFGIKCTKDWTGESILKDDNLPNECFRKYKNIKESYEDHSLFLKRSPYVVLFTYDITDYTSWAKGLQSCGYATDKSYSNKLIKLIEDYQLYIYDFPEGAKSKKQTSDKQVFKRAKINRQTYLTYGLLYTEALEGDNIEFIAEDLGFNLKKLLKYNDLNNDRTLKKGEVVYLEEKRDKAILPYSEYLAKGGESMYYIAQQFGVRLKNLCNLNKRGENYTAAAGDVIKLR